MRIATTSDVSRGRALPGDVPVLTADDQGVVLELAAHFEAIAGGLAQRIVESTHADLVDELPEPPRMTPFIKDAVASAVESYARMVGSGKRPRDVELSSEMLAHVRAFVHRGLPLDALLRAYRLGLASLWNEWARELMDWSPPERLPSLLMFSSSYMFSYMDAAMVRASEAYATEAERWRPSVAAIKQGLVEDILRGRPVDVDRASRMLGYDLRRRHVAAVLSISAQEGVDATTELSDAAAELATLLHCRNPLVIPAGAESMWMWAAPGDDEISPPDRWSGPTSAAVGEVHTGVSGFRVSHEQARHACRVARLAGSPPGTITRYRRVALAALTLSAPSHIRRFVQEELGPLAADDDKTRRLRGTLSAYFREGGVALLTARRIGVHHNTVAYRIKQCEELLDRSLMERSIELQVALRLAETLGPAVLAEPAAG